MMKRLFLTVLFVFVAANVQAAALNVDEFITPQQGGTTKVEKPAEVKADAKNNTVEAATIQDGVNAASELLEDEQPFKFVFSKQGNIGAVAVGYGSYRNLESIKNPDQRNLSLRHAYIEAYMNAKKELAQGFANISVDAQTQWKDAMTKLVTDDETLKNSEKGLNESVKESFERVIKCYVVKEVKNIPDESRIAVYVTVTARSLGKFARPVPAVIEADELKSGLQEVFTEIQSGIMLPEGGRAIATKNGELCYVGYASALISHDDDSDMRTELLNDARKIASTRARVALTGLIVGDKIIWESKLDSQTVKNAKDFQDVTGDDPTVSPADVKKFDERKKEMWTKTVRSDTTNSIRKGVLPPGIQMKTFRDQSGAWYYAVAVYNPSATQAAADLGAAMDAASPIQSIRTGNTGGSIKQDVPKQDTETKMIPTGKFKDDDDEYK